MLVCDVFVQIDWKCVSNWNYNQKAYFLKKGGEEERENGERVGLSKFKELPMAPCLLLFLGTEKRFKNDEKAA